MRGPPEPGLPDSRKAPGHSHPHIVPRETSCSSRDASEALRPLCPSLVTRKDRQQFGDFSLRYGNGTDTVIRMLHMELFKLLLFSLLLAFIIPEDFFPSHKNDIFNMQN